MPKYAYDRRLFALGKFHRTLLLDLKTHASATGNRLELADDRMLLPRPVLRPFPAPSPFPTPFYLSHHCRLSPLRPKAVVPFGTKPSIYPCRFFSRLSVPSLRRGVDHKLDSAFGDTTPPLLGQSVRLLYFWEGSCSEPESLSARSHRNRRYAHPRSPGKVGSDGWA